MKMKIIPLLISLLMLINLSSVSAYRNPVFTNNLGAMPISCSIYSDQAGVNGIHTGDNMIKVKSILGEPKYTSDISSGGGKYYYDNLEIVFVDFSGEGNPIVVDIKARGNAITLDGVKVGMADSVLSKVYGTADVIYIEKHSAPKLSQEKNKKYRDRDKTVYTYYANECLTMSFVVNNGVIKEIHIHLSD